MTQAAPALVRKEVVVDAPTRARVHSLHRRLRRLQAPGAQPARRVARRDHLSSQRVGGNIYDRAEDGRECHWARILVYEPPHRVVFSWDIGPTWQLEPNQANTSEVEVRFVADGADRTRVELEHRNIDRHGPGWESVRNGVEGDDGWPLYLTRFAALFAAT